MPRYGCRNMYRLTGEPGWVRFGYSPGWPGRSSTGLGPCAEYLFSDNWPFAWDPGREALGRGQAFQGKDELSLLKAREEFLSRQLEEVKKRIEELEQE